MDSQDPGSENDALSPHISKVETGLSPETLIEGDQTWTIAERMNHYGVTGVSIAVIDSFKIAWVKSYGIMDSTSNEPVTPQTLFQAGSISKPVAAYGALELVEEGKISLDENVNTYLTSWQLPENKFTQEQPVALKHLLSHTGGLSVHGFLGYRPGLNVPSLVQVLNGVSPANSFPIRVGMAPGTQYRYSGGGYCIMQQMLIDVSGQSFPEVLKAKVLDPLDMKNSTYEQPLPPEKLPLAATGYLPDRTEVIGKHHIYPEMAAAGLWTTAEDLAKFAIDIQLSLKGESNKVLSPQMTEKMLTPAFEDFIGLGIFLNHYGEEVYFGHGGWDEGFSSEMTAHKTKGYGVVVLTNSNHPAFINELIRSVARAYNWKGYVEPAYSKKEIEPEFLQQVTGRYKINEDMALKVFAKEGLLYAQAMNENEPSELVRIDEETFVRRNSQRKIRFLPHPESGVLHFVNLKNLADKPEFKHPKLNEDQKLAIEWVREKNYDQALAAYKALKQNSELASENGLNNLGYSLLRNDLVEEAITVFKVNVALYPASSNVYDSLGEAYMKNGDKFLAITNYQKSVELDPGNQNGKDMLAKLAAM